MLPSERCDMGKKLAGNDFAARAQPVDGKSEIDGVPKDDGGDGEIETGGAVALVFESPVTDFAEAMKEHGAREGVARFALVEIFHIFGALGQFERDLIRERTRAGLDAAMARGRRGGRKPV